MTAVNEKEVQAQDQNNCLGDVPVDSAFLLEDDDDDEAPDLINLTIDDEVNTKQELEEVTPNLSDSVPAASNSVPNKPSTNISENIHLPPCPVTILSGFLGSGKTTLIQYILQSPDHGKRIAVIENEFGGGDNTYNNEGFAVESMIARDGIDPQSNSLQDLIELPNGCICCTVKDSLVTTLEVLLDKRHDLDYILIEASGMANPGPIASVFWLDDALESRLKLDGIVTLVDGVHILEQLETTEEAAQQIAYADRIVLNKMDLLLPYNETHQQDQTSTSTPASSASSDNTAKRISIDLVENKLRQLHPTAPILRTSFSKIPNLDWILNADCFGGKDRLEELERSMLGDEIVTMVNSDSNDNNHNHSHSHSHDEENHDCTTCREITEPTHKHTESISTIALQTPGSVDLKKLNAWLADILWPNQDETDRVLTAMLHEQSIGEVAIKSSALKRQIQQIFRIKGIASATYNNDDISGNEQTRLMYYLADTGLDRRRYIVQAVHDLWEVYPASDELMFRPNEKRVCKLVIIGKFLNEEKLRSGFENCFISY